MISKFSLKGASRLTLVAATLALGLLTAGCGGDSSSEALSEQVPARRGAADVGNEFKTIVADVLGAADADVVGGADLRDDLGATDEQLVEIAAEVKEYLGVELSSSQIDGLTTVDTAIALIESQS